MPLFVCEDCHCVENTAVSRYIAQKIHREKHRCSECDPKVKTWHGKFEKNSWADLGFPPVENREFTVLYHATYGAHIDSILRLGLGAVPYKNWPDSKDGVVYLAKDEEIATSYAESADSVPEDWLDQIVVIQVAAPTKELRCDSNVLDDDSTYELSGVIPPHHLKIIRNTASESKGA